ncbi:MAG: hypothetical protein J1D89_07890 [Agathobacter sp.]|nr:hypothetical protein [Agathobacter sp.]
MGLLKRLFRRNDDYRSAEYDEEAAGTRYGTLDDEKPAQAEPEELRRIWRPGDSQKYDVVDLCEQMIDISRELEDTRSEYQLVTNYLNDIQTIENLTKEEKEPLIDYATKMTSLEKARSEFLKTEKRLSETQYAQLQEEEDELPDVIKRLQANETYLDTIKKDMSYLEGEKLQWSMQRSEGRAQMRLMRKFSVYLLAIYATLSALFLIVGIATDRSPRIPMLVGTALAAIMGVFILVRYQDAMRDVRQAELNKNRAVTLENRVKIKYVNIKNAVDYACEKYHTKGSRDLAQLYELYQEEMRERERQRQNNDRLEESTRALITCLEERHHLYDAKVWENHANAIIDPREMVELKHDLITRRQKLRERIEYNINTLSSMKKEILGNLDRLGANGPYVWDILRKLEDISASF